MSFKCSQFELPFAFLPELRVPISRTSGEWWGGLFVPFPFFFSSSVLIDQLDGYIVGTWRRDCCEKNCATRGKYCRSGGSDKLLSTRMTRVVVVFCQESTCVSVVSGGALMKRTTEQEGGGVIIFLCCVQWLWHFLVLVFFFFLLLQYCLFPHCCCCSPKIFLFWYRGQHAQGAR